MLKITKKLSLILVFLLFYTSNTFASDFWQDLWGQTPDDRIYGGMWTVHLRPGSQKKDNWQNDLVGGVYKSVFAGFFKNSFNDWSFGLGIQRDVYQHVFKKHPIKYTLGYRVGLIYGYDERLMHLAGQTPILPFAQIVSNVSYKHLGWEVTYTGVVVSTSFYFSFH